MAKKIDPRKDPLKYMETLPDKRRVCSCLKHQLFQTECKDCVAEWTAFWDQRDEWTRNHKYHDENFQVIYHGNAKEEAARRAKAAKASG